MNDEARQTNTAPAKAGSVQLIAAVLIAVGGIVGYYVLKTRPEAWMSWAALLGGFVLALIVFATSPQGRAFWQFVLDARVELRKVFWPTREETMKMTMLVLGFVVVASFFFWLLDLGLASVTRLFTGQSG